MRLGKVVKTPIEVKRYSIEYVDWLDITEYVQSVVFTITPSSTNPLIAVASSIGASATAVTFLVSGGDDGETYDVVAKITTTGGQVKEDSVLFAVRSS